MMQITLGSALDLDQFIQIARFGAQVAFSPEYEGRVTRAQQLIAQAISEDRVMYGVTTGFGSLSTRVISSGEVQQLQRNIVLSHSTSVGEPYTAEQARATMLMMLQNIGQGHSGVRLEVLQLLRDMLNRGVIPWVPREGSVGYLAPEAHLALVLIGEGQAYWQGELMPGKRALEQAGLTPIPLGAKEGLALVSGTTSVTALGALALYDLIKAAKSADIIGAVSLETLKGVMRAFDPRVMQVRPHPEQAGSADNVRRILADSGVLKHYEGTRLQDALSLRCIPQLHGAAKKTLYDAKGTIEIEMNSCCDNPIIWEVDGVPDVIPSCNCDSSYVGIAMDSAAIAATILAKMSERRNNRIIGESMSGYPAFLVGNPGLNSGLMIPQYSQAGLLNDMRILATSAVIDNTPTCCNQEDYVAMGYNASKKAIQVAERLEYILAIELLSGYQAQQFLDPQLARSTATARVFQAIGQSVPVMKEDMFLHPHIEFLKDFIHSGQLLALVEDVVGPLR